MYVICFQFGTKFYPLDVYCSYKGTVLSVFLHRIEEIAFKRNKFPPKWCIDPVWRWHRSPHTSLTLPERKSRSKEDCLGTSECHICRRCKSDSSVHVHVSPTYARFARERERLTRKHQVHKLTVNRTWKAECRNMDTSKTEPKFGCAHRTQSFRAALCLCQNSESAPA